MSSSTAKMMDFDNILDIASQNQGLSSVQKRYSLQTGPPKKDPKSKGVNPAAVQALLKKRQNDSKQKEIENKKQKEQLLAKRVELKSDRKARAMASRTKDNFKGYNGIPVVETPKKRGSKGDKRQDHPNDSESFRNNAIDPLDDEDNYEYGQTDSEGEPEPEPEMMRPQKPMGVSGPSKSVSKKVSGPPKPPPPAMNFADLLRLAEKKQFEPVELKPKVKKEERLRTAEEIRELEMERKAKRPDKSRDSKVDGGREGRPLSTSSSVRKNTTEKEQKHNKLQRNSTEKSSLPSRSGNKVHSAGTSDKGLSFSKQSDKERNREKTPHSDRERSKMGISASSVAALSKNPSKAPSSQVSTKHVSSRTALTQKPSSSSDLSSRKDSFSLHQKGASGIQGNKHSSGGGAGQRSQHATSQQTRPLQGSSLKQGSIAGEMKSNRGDSNGNSLRPSLGGPSKAGKQCQGRPMGIPLNKPGGGPQTRPGGTSPERGGSRPPGPFRPGSGGQVPGRPNSNLESGPGRPKCTVVSETISSKNVGGPRPGVSPRPGMQQRPGMTPGMRPGMTPGMRPGMTPGMRPGMTPGMRPGMTPGMRPGMTPGMRPGMTPGMRPGIPPRPMMNRPPGTMLPPITIAYKRKYEEEEEEYDPEMDDFIDDGGEEQDEISRHIKEIFGYDRNRYKDESDYALKFMESSWKDLQKEEARSLRMAVQEDLEEERREEEELKRKKAKRKKVN